jgi:hypothetical protein
MNRHSRSRPHLLGHHARDTLLEARETLAAIGHAPARGLATGIAMVRVLRIAREARQDDLSDALEPVRPDELVETTRPVLAPSTQQAA